MDIFFRFIFVGCISTGFHILITNALLLSIITNPFIANFIAFCSTLLLSFYGHYYFTFKSDSKKRYAIIKFFIISAIAFMLNNASLDIILGLQLFPELVATNIAALIIPLVSFVANRLWVFQQQEK